jgi:carboxymethylenebutenolidase
MMTHWGEGTPTPFELMKDIRCPVYGFFGDLDTNPSPADVDRFEVELKRYGIPHVFHRYPKAGHGFQNPARDKGRNSDEIATAEVAWDRMLELMSGVGAQQDRARAHAV